METTRLVYNVDGGLKEFQKQLQDAHIKYKIMVEDEGTVYIYIKDYTLKLINYIHGMWDYEDVMVYIYDKDMNELEFEVVMISLGDTKKDVKEILKMVGIK